LLDPEGVPGYDGNWLARLCGCHILNNIGGMIMNRFKITQDIIEDGIDETIKNLTKLKSLLDQNFFSGQPKTISFGALNREGAGNITAAKKKDSRFEYMKNIQKAIYVISAPDFPYSWEDISDNNGAFKKLKETTALPRISDKSHWNDQEGKRSKCLYVGSSHDIAGRVIQHFWKCVKGTYSLHLIDWDWWDKKDEVQIDIWDASEIDDIHLQIVEDIVWRKYKPLFGRPGAK
jgi:hypothetical protein